MTLKEYIKMTLLEVAGAKADTYPVDVNLDIAIMPQSGWKEGTIQPIIIVDESPSPYSSRIKLTITVH